MSFGIDTTFLLYFGENKNAADISKADILYGEDGKTCVVKSVIRDTKDMLYRLQSPYFKEIFLGEFNSLALYDEAAGRVININICDYFEKDKYWKRRMKTILMPISYDYEPTKNDPFMIGLIIGCPKIEDNSIENGSGAKEQILSLMKNYAARRIENIGDIIHNKVASPSFDLEELMKVYNYRFIPKEYIFNAASVRMTLVDGLLNYFRSLEQNIEKKSGATSKLPRTRSKSSVRYESSTIDLHEAKKRPTINFATYDEEIRPLSASTRGRDRSSTSLNSVRSFASLTHSESNKNINSCRDLSSRSSNRDSFGGSNKGIGIDDLRRGYNTLYSKNNKNSTLRNPTINTKISSSRGISQNVADPLTPTRKAPKVYETNIEINDEVLAEQVLFILRSLGQKTSYNRPKITISGIIGKGGKVYCDFDIEKIGVESACRITTEPPNAKIILGNTLLAYTS